MMDPWIEVWRDGVAPCLSTAGLVALRRGLEQNDAALIQKETTEPPPRQYMLDWPADGACPIGYCGWQGDGLKTVGAVEKFFTEVCFKADQRLGEPSAVRHFLEWVDDMPREEMLPLLLAEVNRTLTERVVALTQETAV